MGDGSEARDEDAIKLHIGRDQYRLLDVPTFTRDKNAGWGCGGVLQGREGDLRTYSSAEMWSGSEDGSYFRLYHSTLG